ncbi:MAG TPA: four helix bundle protein [Phycisphaerae bacterium]|nr:four helix bundle protein [Phycisphaerales bacterium]HRX84708.1 four helix bundle protein [Phycisphaerae bacterium]
MADTVAAKRTAAVRRSARGDELVQRTKAFALRIINLAGAMPYRSRAAQVIAGQVTKCGTSVGAQYREARRARSDAEFVSKLESSLQKLDETTYWLELTAEAAIVPPRRLQGLLNEAEQLTAILVASVRTVKRRRRH